jgi:predicted ATPase
LLLDRKRLAWQGEGRVAEIKADDPAEQKLDKLEAVLAMGASRVQAIAPIFAALLSIPFEGRYPPLTLSPAQQRRQTLAALLDQLEELARHESILLVFEDVQWADATSLELLDLMVDRLGHLPVLAIFTFRPGFEPAWAGLRNVTTLPLGRLERPQVQAMVAQVTGGRALPSEVMKEIINKTDGIPLFVEELTKTVLEAGVLVEDADGYRLDGPLPQLAIPATLQDSLMARLDRLAPIKEIAQIGSAIGREFSYTLLKTVAGRDDAALRSGLAQLEEAELVFRRGGPPEAVYKFKHALVQDAAYESLLKSRRQVLHRHIAEALRDHFPTIAETEPEVVAHHFTEAGLLEAAIEWWGKAAEQALRRSAYIETVAHCAKAVSLAKRLADGPAQRLLRVRLQIAHGNALMLARGLGAAETTAAFARAQEIAAGIDDVPERFSALRGLWNGSFDRGEMAPMRELAAAMMREAESLPGLPELCTAHRLCAITCQVEGNFDGAREHLERAIAAYDGKHPRTPALDFWGHQDVASMAHLAWVLWPLGEIDRAGRFAEEAIVLAQRCGHVPTLAYAHGVTSNLEVMRRDARRVMTHGRAVVDLTREHGLPYWLAHGTIHVGWALWHSGDREAGEAGMREGMVLLRERAAQVFPFPYRILQAEVEAEVGRVEAGLAILDSQRVAIERSGQRMFDAEVHRVRGELLLRLAPADVAGAEAAFTHAVEIARLQHTKTFELRTATGLARLWHDQGKRTEARDLLAPIYGWFTEGFDTPVLREAKALLEQLRA